MPNRDELLKLIDSGDTYGLMLASVKAWLKGHHPTAEYSVVVAHIRDGVPDVQIPVTPPACSDELPPGPA